jgi:hypothetical protein
MSVSAQTNNPTPQGATPDESSKPAQTNSTSDPVVLVDAAKIYNENPLGWVGKAVVLQNVTVQDTNKSGDFWVGSDSNHRILVVKQNGNDNLKSMTFHKGDVITISGTVQAASRYMAQDKSTESGSMHDAEKTAGVFLLADSINVDSSTHK